MTLLFSGEFSRTLCLEIHQGKKLCLNLRPLEAIWMSGIDLIENLICVSFLWKPGIWNTILSMVILKEVIHCTALAYV